LTFPFIEQAITLIILPPFQSLVQWGCYNSYLNINPHFIRQATSSLTALIDHNVACFEWVG
jgi:hypothetical protein